MTSLQRRMLKRSKNQPKNNTQISANDSFESFFSAGLDLSEFSGNSNTQSNPRTSAAAQLAQIKANAAARIQSEEKEEANLEKRVAGVISLAKTTNDGDEKLNVDLKAVNPHSHMHAMGEASRENNFLQFQTSNMRSDNGFLSSLVQNHDSEFKELSGKRRMMSSNNKNNNGAKVDLGSQMGRAASKMQMRKLDKLGDLRRSKNATIASSGKKMATKKSRKSKF